MRRESTILILRPTDHGVVASRGVAIPITASLLYGLIECPQRVALDAFGDPAKRDEVSPFVKLLWERGTLFERETITKLQVPFLDLSVLEDSDKERQTLDAMSR